MAETRVIGRWLKQYELEGWRKSIVVGPDRAAIVIDDGVYGDPHIEERVYTRGFIRNQFSNRQIEVLSADLAPFSVVYELHDFSGALNDPASTGFPMPVLSRDRKLISGQIQLTLAVSRDRPGLLHQLRRERDAITARDVAAAIRDEFLAQVVQATVAQIDSDDLRGTPEQFVTLYEETRLQLESQLENYGLTLINFAASLLPLAAISAAEQEALKQRLERALAEREIEQAGGERLPARILHPKGPEPKPRKAARDRPPPSALRSLISALFVLGMIAGAGVGLYFIFNPGPPSPVVEVVHWTTGHLTREGQGLLPDMAEQFNKANYRTEDGTKIEVQVYDAPSELQSKYLIPRVQYGTKLDLNEITNGYVVENIPDPTILTPSSAHWLVTANYELGREVVDIDGAASIVKPVIGIVTYEEMARCLGWPDKELGFEDIIALRDDPEGWASYPSCARAEWGKKPLLAFTDPTTSSTGRSLHLSLYSIAAGKAPEDLTIDDVNDPDVVAYVKNFQTLIDHYTIGTTVLNTKIYQGTGFGHFFIMPEDNLIHLYEGTERSFLNGIKTTAPPIEKRMVMIYPKEGAMPRNNCACIVDADWVSPEQTEAAAVWIDFIREDEQQRAFMAAGFRPGTDIALDDPASKIRPEFGLNPKPPRVVLNPSLTKPEVAAAIDAAWVDVKRPGIVTFVVDTSGSMTGEKIQQAKDGLKAALDAMAPNNQVGFLSFNETVIPGVAVAPLSENKFQIAAAVGKLRADGQTALYDAVKAGVEMTDAVEGEPDAIRAVVVLTDGQANKGSTGVDDIIRMSSSSESPIVDFPGFVTDLFGRDASGRLIAKSDMIGSSLALLTEHEVQIFFIGIGEDADLDIGRMLAGATSAEFQGTAEDDLANLLEEFSKYF